MSITVLIIAVVFGIGVLTFVSLMSKKGTNLDKEKYRASWEKIQNYLGNEDTFSMAVLEADKLLDKALKETKFKGSTMGERLVSAKRVLSKKDHVWMAHKLRNKIAHETDVKVNKKQAQAALSAFHRALRDLEAL